MPLDQIDVDYEDEPKSKEMPLVEHIEELRGHIVRSVIAVFVLGIGAFLMKSFIFGTVIFGPIHDWFLTYRGFCWLSRNIVGDESMCIHIGDVDLQNTQMTGQFMTHLEVSVWTGVILSFPYIVWEFWRFIKPGLSRREISYTQGIVFFTSLLFFLGVLFGYFLLVPTAVQFLVNYQVDPSVANRIDISNYISFMVGMVFTCGIVFELPMMVYFLSKLGLLTPAIMRSSRRYAVVILVIVAAVVTPGSDLGSLVLVFMPLYMLYEVSIFVSARVERDREQQGLA
ncbi:MAG: twin-arginine translocase subunit TatC [Chitinophagales bacterium]|nr:twin-arginine translocase subunit TatC [Chitinophagales bacterium]